MAVGTVVSVGAYPIGDSSPLGGLFERLSRSSDAILSLRNTQRLNGYGRTDVRVTYLTLGHWEIYGEVLNVWLATTNTVVLISSSVTMVMAWASLKMNDFGKFRMYLGATILLSFVFLVVKYFEYSHHLHAGEGPDRGNATESGHNDAAFGHAGKPFWSH